MEGRVCLLSGAMHNSSLHPQNSWNRTFTMESPDGLSELLAQFEEADQQHEQSSDNSSAASHCSDPPGEEENQINLANGGTMTDQGAGEITDLANYGPSLDQLESHTRAEAKKLGSKSTGYQYARKIEEYVDFSKVVFGDGALTVDRAFKFLQFQAHRPMRVVKDAGEDAFTEAFGDGESNGTHQSPQKKRKTLKKTGFRAASKYKFNAADYKKVMDHIQRDIIGTDGDDWKETDRLQSIEKYYSALVDHASNDVCRQLKMHVGIKKLVDNVNRRSKKLKVEGDSELLNRVTEKFRYPELYPKVESILWQEYQTKGNWTYFATNMRTRYTYLMTVQTCTRHEATLTCMISSFDIVHREVIDELEPYPILIRNIYKGKNNQDDSNTILQAKSIRHKQPHLCEQGALAIYLFARFYAFDEDFDLCSDQANAWFKIRTAPALNMSREKYYSSRFNKMRSVTYYTKLCQIFAFLGYNQSHVLHFGRSCQPVLLELAEVMTAVIELHGGWDPKVYNKHYSLNTAFEALRVAAGFRREKGFYRLPRNHLRVPEELKKLVYPNIQRAKEKFLKLSKQQQFKLNTAQKFLRVMDHLAEVFVQDTCQLRLEGRNQHLLYQHPLFRTEEYLKYEREFRLVFANSTNPLNDPTLDPIKKAAPLMGTHLGDIKCMVHNGFTSMGRQLHCMGRQVETVMNIMNSQTALNMHMNHVLNGAFNAHINSPFRPGQVGNVVTPGDQTGNNSPVMPRPLTSPSRPSRHITDETSPGAVSFATTTTVAPTATSPFPPFDRLSYNSLDQIYKDWMGIGDSVFCCNGGLKSIYDDKVFRKSLGEDQNSRATAKKMLQKMRRIGEYICANTAGDSDVQAVFRHLRQLLAKSGKKEETLTGLDLLVRKELKDKE